MLAVPAMTAWIEGIFFDNLEMPSDFFGDCGWIFIYFLGDLFEGHTVPESTLAGATCIAFPHDGQNFTPSAT